MGTYCKNHVLEEVNTAAPQSEDGKVTLKPTKEGSCIHMGGCNTAHDDLYQLEYVYQPSKKDKKAAKKTAEVAEKEKEAAAEAIEKEPEASSKEGTTAEEKPTEEAPTTS